MNSKPQRRHRSAAQRREILAQFDESGLTRAAFSAATGIAPSTLALWLRQRRLEAEVRPVPVEIEEAPSGMRRADAPPPGSPVAVVTRPDGLRIEILDPEALNVLVANRTWAG